MKITKYLSHYKINTVNNKYMSLYMIEDNHNNQ